KKDTDGNGVTDDKEDPDFDALTNFQEQVHGTNPRSADTDGDGWDDATEILDGTDPLSHSGGPKLRIVSAEVSFLNELAEEPPAETTWSVSSLPVSYLNALLDTPPQDVRWSVYSLPVSYLNSLLESGPGSLFFVSPLVSYENR